MNSILSINSLLKQQIGITSDTAINGGSILTPLTGTFTWDGNTYTKMYVFTALSGTNSITLLNNTTVGILLVGAGGGSGSTMSQYSGIPVGGAGAGGVVKGRMLVNGMATYSITIGSGGSAGIPPTISTNPGNAVPPGNGGDTKIIGTGINEKGIGGGASSYNNGQMANTTLQNGTNNGKNGGSAGGGHFTYSTGGVGGTATQTQGNASSSTNTRALTYMGNNGGTKTSTSTGSGGGGSTTAGTSGSLTSGIAGLGGTGYLFNVSGTSNDYTGKYYATGGCGGNFASSSGVVIDQSSITSVGGVPGGTSSIMLPPKPTTYGTGASGPGVDFSITPAPGYYGYPGQEGMQGICIILVP